MASITHAALSKHTLGASDDVAQSSRHTNRQRLTIDRTNESRCQIPNLTPEQERGGCERNRCRRAFPEKVRVALVTDFGLGS
jgi:hypothetical protein